MASCWNVDWQTEKTANWKLLFVCLLGACRAATPANVVGPAACRSLMPDDKEFRKTSLRELVAKPSQPGVVKLRVVVVEAAPNCECPEGADCEPCHDVTVVRDPDHAQRLSQHRRSTGRAPTGLP